MTLAALGIFALKFLIFFALVVFCIVIGTMIVVSLLFYCEQHFNNMWLEMGVILISSVLWCLFGVWIIITVLSKISQL